LAFIPAPFHAVAEFDAEGGYGFVVGIDFEFGSPLGEAVAGPGVFNAEDGLAGGETEPGQGFVAETRAGNLDIGAVFEVVSIA